VAALHWIGWQKSPEYALPVLTIGNADRIVERAYRERCAIRVVEIGLELQNYLGAGRVFIP
jgi:hypothetical protein